MREKKAREVEADRLADEPEAAAVAATAAVAAAEARAEEAAAAAARRAEAEKERAEETAVSPSPAPSSVHLPPPPLPSLHLAGLSPPAGEGRGRALSHGGTGPRQGERNALLKPVQDSYSTYKVVSKRVRAGGGAG
jgi:membrane protein involved in colicin uptake